MALEVKSSNSSKRIFKQQLHFADLRMTEMTLTSDGTEQHLT